MSTTLASTPIPAQPGAAEGAVPEIKVTYRQLSAYHLAKLMPGSVRNSETALNGWLSHKGLTLESVIGAEFGDHFKGELDSHLRYLEEKPHRRKRGVVKGLKEGSLRNRASFLNGWRRSWLSLVAEEREKAKGDKIPGEIREALRHLVRRWGMKPHTFAVTAGVEPKLFRRWHKGELNPSPHPKTTEALKKIEGYCGLEEGTLTSLVKARQVSAGPDDRPRTAFARRLMTASYERYKLRDFPPRLKAEWDELYALMTPTLEPDGPLQRNNQWFVDPETGDCPTAGKTMNTLSGLFGYLTLPVEGRSFLIPEKKRDKKKKKEKGGEEPPPKYTVVKGEGFSQDSLTLALVTDVPLVKRYLEFVKRRAGGVYNTETEQIINLCCMLLREGTGFVRQHADYGARLQRPVAVEEWDATCEDAHKRLRSQLRSLKKKGQIVQSRDVDEPIDFILNDPHPLRYLYKLADLMEADLPAPSAKGVERAVAYRDMFLVRFLTANPLRISHFSEMTWLADNTGNLYQERDGSWWLRFPKDAFKNRTALKKDRFTKNYRAPLPRSLYGYVQAYLSTYRPLLVGAEECDYVFRPHQRGGVAKHKSGTTKPMLVSSLSTVLHKKARLYLRCAGFGAHAYRHIIATDYLLNHPSGIMVAASILHDTPEMVLKHYGHLQKSDFFRYWVAYHEKQLEAARGEEMGQGAGDGEEVREVA